MACRLGKYKKGTLFVHSPRSDTVQTLRCYLNRNAEIG
jgi:hypothetical protein